MNIIKIDTSSNKETIVSLSIHDNEIIIRKKFAQKKSQMVLGMIDDLLARNDFDIKAIDEIVVVEGPGSFTGLRVGISVANALAFWLNIPINGKPAGSQILPRYE